MVDRLLSPRGGRDRAASVSGKAPNLPAASDAASSQQNRIFFGVSLDLLYSSENIALLESGLPLPVHHCVRALEENPIEGMFTISGSFAEIDRLKQSFERGERPDLSRVENRLSIAGVLETYLRELPEPITTTKTKPFMAAAKEGLFEETIITYLRSAVAALPPPNRAVLGAVLRVLHLVSIAASTLLSLSLSLSRSRIHHPFVSLRITHNRALCQAYTISEHSQAVLRSLGGSYGGILFSVGDDNIVKMKKRTAKNMRVVEYLVKYQPRIFADDLAQVAVEEEVEQLATRLTIEVLHNHRTYVLSRPCLLSHTLPPLSWSKPTMTENGAEPSQPRRGSPAASSLASRSQRSIKRTARSRKVSRYRSTTAFKP